MPDIGLSAWSSSGIVSILLMLYCLVDILRSEFKGRNDKLIWILVILLVPCLGSILYLVIGRNQKI